MLGIAIGCAVSAVMAFLDRQYEGDLFWTTPLIGAVVFAFLAYSMRKKAKAEEEAIADAARRKLEAMEEAGKKEAQAKEARLAEEQARRNRFRHESFPVAGVTFKNDDKTDRQQILREIALNDDGSCAVTFEEDEEKGEDSTIRVMTEYGCVGHVRHNDKAKIRRFFDRKVNTMVLAVERFENDDGEKIYRADIVIGMDREDPEQQWYFDELPES
jgi:hypothetical protein